MPPEMTISIASVSFVACRMLQGDFDERWADIMMTPMELPRASYLPPHRYQQRTPPDGLCLLDLISQHKNEQSTHWVIIATGLLF